MVIDCIELRWTLHSEGVKSVEDSVRRVTFCVLPMAKFSLTASRNF